MEDRTREYQHQIEIAQRGLQRAQNDVERSAWQKVIDGWRHLLDVARPQPQLQQQPQQQLEDDK
jgi:hypothetical protein